MAKHKRNHNKVSRNSAVNMPLRDLFYICSEYQKLVNKKSL